jgi:hypothetical protein
VIGANRSVVVSRLKVLRGATPRSIAKGLISKFFPPPPPTGDRTPLNRLLGRRAAMRSFFAFLSAAILPHIPNKRLAALIHMHMLDTDDLRAAVP